MYFQSHLQHHLQTDPPHIVIITHLCVLQLRSPHQYKNEYIVHTLWQKVYLRGLSMISSSNILPREPYNDTENQEDLLQDGLHEQTVPE